MINSEYKRLRWLAKEAIRDQWDLRFTPQWD